MENITNEEIEKAAEAYSDTVTTNVASAFKDPLKTTAKRDWLAGYNAALMASNAQMLFALKKIGERDYTILELKIAAAKARDLISFIEAGDFTCEAGQLANSTAWKQLKQALATNEAA